MKSDLHELLGEVLPRDEIPEAEAALASWAEARVTTDSALAQPPGGQRLQRTLASVERFSPFFAGLRDILGLDDVGLRAALSLVDEESGWTGMSGLMFRDFAPGPGGLASEAGLIRVAAGTTFPRHTHLGREVGWVLEGVLLLEGRAYLPGDVVVSEPGTAHEFSAGPARDLVLVVAHAGIRFGD